MAVGFKTQAIRDEEAKSNNSPVVEKEEMIDVPLVVAETFDRLESLNNFIVSKQFAELNEEAKKNILNDFSYMSKIASII